MLHSSVTSPQSELQEHSINCLSISIITRQSNLDSKIKSAARNNAIDYVQFDPYQN